MPACPDADRAALIEAVATDTNRLHALAQRMLGDHHSAQDAVQDACLRAFVSLDRYRGEASMGTWLYRITTNVCLDELRRRKRVTMEPASEKADGWLVEPDFSDGVTLRSELSGALDALPAAQRSAMLLAEVLGYSYADAGAVLGVPKGTVASRIHRAKDAVRTFLDAAA